MFVLPSTYATAQRLSVKARYNVFASQCASIIEIGAGSDQRFELVKGTLDGLEQKMENPRRVVEDQALRPGRPATHTIRKPGPKISQERPQNTFPLTIRFTNSIIPQDHLVK